MSQNRGGVFCQAGDNDRMDAWKNLPARSELFARYYSKRLEP